MAADRRPSYSYLAAGVLALITLFVFWTLRDYGPQSTLRRFNQALFSQDAQALAQVIDEPINSPKVTRLVWALKTLGVADIPRIARMDETQPNEVTAALYYHNVYGGVIGAVFIVRKSGHAWHIDVEKSLAALNRTYGANW